MERAGELRLQEDNEGNYIANDAESCNSGYEEGVDGGADQGQRGLQGGGAAGALAVGREEAERVQPSCSHYMQAVALEQARCLESEDATPGRKMSR